MEFAVTARDGFLFLGGAPNTNHACLGWDSYFRRGLVPAAHWQAIDPGSALGFRFRLGARRRLEFGRGAVPEQPESAGGMLVAAVQCSIAAGAALGG